MPIVVRCPNPACGVPCSVAEADGGKPVKCAKCGKPFAFRPTLDGHHADTKKARPTAKADPFPTLPAEFGRYRVLRLLGRGGMGAVYLAEDSQLGRQVALKIPSFDAAGSPLQAERFVREARSAAVLQHPNICTVFDAGQIEGRPFITMAYIEGKSLADEIDPDAPMPQCRAAEIARKVARALEHAHGKGTVHRDLKPANVMVAADGEPVVMDFGLAKRVDANTSEAKLTRIGGIVGTPSYMSPEQVRGDGSIGPATDIYSLGVMLFEMLTGKTPYSGSMAVVMGRILHAPVPPVREYRPDVDARLDSICRRAMAKEPAARFASMAEFAGALGEPASAPVATMPPPARALPPKTRTSTATIERSPFDTLEGATTPPPASKKPRKGRAKPAALWRRPVVVAGIAVALAVLATLGAGGVFEVKTKDGILVVEVSEPNAEVYVDGDRVAVGWAEGGKKAEIRIEPGTRKVEVKKDGFTAFGEVVTLEEGKRLVLVARLDQMKPMPGPAALAAEADPFRPKSVWIGDNGNRLTLTVMERKGEDFKARFEIGDQIDRELSGIIKDGQISWLAKDVRVIQGGSGADNQGTIARDKDGPLIHFTWGDKDGSGPFALRLVKAESITPETAPAPDARANEAVETAKLEQLLLNHTWYYHDNLFPPGERFRFDADGTFHTFRWLYWVVGPREIRVHYDRGNKNKETGILFTFDRELIKFTGEFKDPNGRLHKITGTRQ